MATNFLPCVLFLAVLTGTILGGPVHEHKHDHAHVHPVHPDKSNITSERYLITIKAYSGKPNPVWNITEEDKQRRNVPVILRAIELLSHATSGEKQEFPQALGYTGIEFNHFVNGDSLHIWKLPRCKNWKLEHAVVKYTAGNHLPEQSKRNILCEIEKCDKTRKHPSCPK